MAVRVHSRPDALSPSVAWKPDVLGADFEQATVDLGRDAEGDVAATLVRYLPTPAKPRSTLFGSRAALVAANTDVLYLHGWSDYFFQTHLAEFWRAQGARFFALDLRKYGRSLRAGQTPGYVDDLTTYDADIEAALTIMGHDPKHGSSRRLVVMGHSTGGLVLSLWLARNPGRAAALILNSPWLEYQLAATGRQVSAAALKISSKVDPKGALLNPDLGFYHRALSRDLGGEWVFNNDWRPPNSFTPRIGWLNAILAGHARVAAGLDISAPVLTLLSARTIFQARWSEAMRRADTVIDVTRVGERAVKLGRVVTVAHVSDALHDVFLSAPDVRGQAFNEVTRWLGAYL